MDIVNDIYANHNKYDAEILEYHTCCIIKLKINGNCFIGETTKCFKGQLRKEENFRLSKLYWESNKEIENEQAVYEMLVDGQITVVEIVKEINENI